MEPPADDDLSLGDDELFEELEAELIGMPDTDDLGTDDL
jgi:hypothetical protein